VAWIDADTDADVEAAALLPAAVEDVFEFLADLENHWRVADRFVRVLDLHRSNDGRATGGTVRLRGPLGMRRTVTTRVAAAKAPRILIGTAEIGGGTRARVSWSLAGHLDSTRVRLSAKVERASGFDRLLLRLGGRWWLRRRFAAILDSLSRELERRSTPPRSQRPGAGTPQPSPS
jgi:hypothetical protein